MQDFERLDGQVIVVSGAGRGIGRGIAMVAAARGARVIVNDYGTDIAGLQGGDSGPAADVVRAIADAGGEAAAVVADVGTEIGARETVQAALDTFGRIDGLVHAACIFPEQCEFEKLPRTDYKRVVAVTVDGSWGLAQAAWPHMKAQRHGRIVLIQSAAGFYGRIGMPAYSIAKSAMIGFTGYLRQEGAAHGILVNNLSPVAWTRVPAIEDGLAYMESLFPPEDLGTVTALLLHPAFSHSGLYLHAGGGVVTSMSLPETRGVAFARDGFTPSAIHARLGEILDRTDQALERSSVDEVGAALFAAIQARDAAIV